MIFRRCVRFLLFAVPVLLLVAGCGRDAAKAKLDRIEQRVEQLEEVVPGNETVTIAPEYPPRGPSPYAGSELMRYWNDSAPVETAEFAAEGKLVIPRTGMASVAWKGYICVLGGHGPGDGQSVFRNDIELIDSKARALRIPTQLVRRRYHTTEEAGGKIYIMGGMTVAEGRWDWRKVYPDVLEIFDPATGSITRGAPLPSSRYLAASEILEGRIYLLGGTPPRRAGDEDEKSLAAANSLPDARLFIYEIATDRWIEGAPMNVARQCELVAHDGKLYAVAGYSGRTAVASFEEYDPATDRWTRLPDLPFPLSAQRCVVLEDLLFCFGDYVEMSKICVYDFRRKKWAKLAITMEPSRQGAAAVLGEKVFVFGGNAGEGRSIQEGGAGAKPLARIQVFSVEKLRRAARAALRD